MRIDLTFPSDPASVARARRAIEPLAEVAPDLVVSDSRLLVSELVTNSVRHVPPDQAGDIRLVVERAAGHVRVEIHDAGPGIGPWEAKPNRRDAIPHGWGLELLDRVASRWGARNDGSACVWFEIDV